MKHPLSVLATLLLAGAAWPQSITLPATLTVPQPGLVIVTPSAVDADAVGWFSLDPGFQIVPSTLLKSDQTAVGVAVKEGSYRLRAVAAKSVGGKAALSPVAECTITVGAPTPPTPPTPVPPTDPFTQALQAAYAQEAAPDKAKQVAYLASVYQGAASLLAPGMTAGVLFQQLSAAIHNPTLGLPVGALPAVSKVIGNDLNAVLGTDATAAVDGTKAKAAFAKYAAALGGLK